MNLFDLTGKVALVTGSTKGIGEAIVHRLAEHGAKVVVSSRKADACDKVAADINAKHPGHAVAIPCNINYKEQLQNLVDQTHQKLGKIDILICNAALNPYYGSVRNIPDEAIDKIMGSNVRSNIWLCNMVLDDMIEKKDGAIIIVSSVGGMLGSGEIGVYNASKAADFQLARNLAVEFSQHNIRANCIAPGLIKTDFARALWENPTVSRRQSDNLPMRRLGEPDDIAGAAVFLSSQAARYMTGQSIVVDGGMVIV